MPPYSVQCSTMAIIHSNPKSPRFCTSKDVDITKKDNDRCLLKMASREPVDTLGLSSSSECEERCSLSIAKPKKTVRFSEYASMHFYRRRCLDGTSTWYSPDDLKAFRLDTIATIERIVAGTNTVPMYSHSPRYSKTATGTGVDCEDPEHCPRGCETRTPLGTVVRQRHRNDSMNAVFQYQDQCRRQLRLKRSRAAMTLPKSVHIITEDENSTNYSCKNGPTMMNRPTIRLVDVMDPDVLGEIYGTCTQQSQQAAKLAGHMDHWSVCRINGSMFIDDSTTTWSSTESSHQRRD
jgi:hypothetical protein